jgi:hypothetical protein
MILIKPQHRELHIRDGTMAIGLAQASDSSRFPFPCHHEKLPSSSANVV